MEKLRRELVVNPEAECAELLKAVAKIARKVSEDDKYKKLRSESKALARILSKPGGRQLLTSLGFRNHDDDLIFEETDEHASEMAAWCESFLYTKPEIDLVIRLPNGRAKRGGFQKAETVQDVVEFVGYTVRTHDRVLGVEETLEPFAPRSALVASVENAASKMKEAHVDDKAQLKKEREEQQRKLRDDKRHRKLDAQQQRFDALRHFHEDRNDSRDRVERERRRSAVSEKPVSELGSEIHVSEEPSSQSTEIN